MKLMGFSKQLFRYKGANHRCARRALELLYNVVVSFTSTSVKKR